MKLSIAWIFDYIDADWQKQDIEYLISKFNNISAEIEHSYNVDFDLQKFALAKILEKNSEQFKLFIPEWKKEIFLTKRSDSKLYTEEFQESTAYMVCKSENEIRWATLKDFDSDKDGLMPPLQAGEGDFAGDWRKFFEARDVIIEVDNKSITHRPDMWGHRGFAREIAAILQLPFLQAEKVLEQKEVSTFKNSAKSTKTNPISIDIKAEDVCSRFAGLYFDFIENKPCNIFIVSRLIKVGIRPISGIVDLTNYLTLDWSQPVHIYDAKRIEGGITARMAKGGERLLLLDSVEIELSDQDLVISDDKKSLCLAGVMGGLNSSIHTQSKSMFFESANFNAANIRRSALRHKCRTESSMRFEKTLDPNQNIESILRFLHLLKKYNFDFKCADEILSVGIPAEEKTLQISHKYLEQRSGLKFSEYDIIVPLERLGFIVTKNLVESADGSQIVEREIVYSITIPTFRGSKDIEIKEDILEEVIRFYGFDRIDLDLPKIEKSPVDLSKVFKLRRIKNYLASCAAMMEQQNYVVFDEQFMSEVGLKDIQATAEIINPVSENYSRLVTSLLPGLFKNIKDNFVGSDSLRFFEIGKSWLKAKKQDDERFGIDEGYKVSGVFFEKRKAVDFYDCKNYLMELFGLIGLDSNKISWKKIENSRDLWVMPFQSANIEFDGKFIGIAGKIEPMFLSKLGALSESDAFFFEIDGEFLLNFVSPIKKFESLPKYQETFFDLSLLVPLELTVEKLEKILNSMDKLVFSVKLIDFFEKEEWIDSRSLTFRVYLNNPEKTLEKEEIDLVWKNAVESLKKVGANLR